MPTRIVLADDHPSYRAVIREMLDQEPDLVVVAEVADGPSAVRAAAEQSPDVVLMDIGMSGMDGISATREIVAQNRSAHVVGLSLHAEAVLVDAMFAAGATGYVLKQDAYADLLHAIHEAIAGRHFVSSNVPSHRQFDDDAA